MTRQQAIEALDRFPACCADCPACGECKPLHCEEERAQLEEIAKGDNES